MGCLKSRYHPSTHSPEYLSLNSIVILTIAIVLKIPGVLCGHPAGRTPGRVSFFRSVSLPIWLLQRPVDLLLNETVATLYRRTLVNSSSSSLYLSTVRKHRSVSLFYDALPRQTVYTTWVKSIAVRFHWGPVTTLALAYFTTRFLTLTWIKVSRLLWLLVLKSVCSDFWFHARVFRPFGLRR